VPSFWDSSLRLDLLLSEAIGEMTAMDRLSEKLNRAAGAAKRVGDRLELRADKLIAREEAANKREDEVFLPHEQRLDSAERGMDSVERALGQMSNGDPLDGSGATGEVAETASTTFPPV
jgi:hypothetical protein